MNVPHARLSCWIYKTLLVVAYINHNVAQVRKTKTAFLGKSVSLQCTKTTADGQPVFWQMKRPGEDPKMMSFNERLREESDHEKYSITQKDSFYYLLIKNATPNDDAEYSCFVLFKEAEADIINLIVYASPSPLVITGWQTPVMEGDTVKLVCQSSGGRPQTALKWTKADEPSLDLGGLVLNTKHNDGTFISRKVYSFTVTRETLTDTFVCNGEIEKLSYNETQNVTLDVKVPPMKPVIDGEMAGDEGETIAVHCHSDAGKPRANITWWSDGRVLGGQLVIVKNPDASYNVNNVLEIPLKREDDNRLLTCKSTNEVLTRRKEKPLERSFNLTVNYKPIVHMKQHYVVNTGSRVTLKCHVEGKPTVVFSWMRNKNAIKSKDKRSRFEIVLSSEFSYLTLFRVNKEDNGIYTCVARNRLGTVSANTTLTVKHPPVVLISQGRKTGVQEHMAITLHCNIEAVPETLDYVLWYHNGELLIETDRLTFAEGNRSFTIHKARRSDRGTYMCKAKNELGESQSNNVLVRVEYAPENIHMSRATYNITESETMPTMSCSASAIPKAAYTWKHDGRRIAEGSKLYFPPVASHELKGNYSCTASNKWGSRTTQIHINVFYAPICQEHQKLKYGVALGKGVAISCYVKANPPAVTFTWRLINATFTSNNTEVNIDGLNAFHAILYKPRKMADYGMISCSARNKIGRMKKPCAIQIVPSGPPEPPVNCTVADVTERGLQMRCSPGFDGGSKQNFLIQKKVLKNYVTLLKKSSSSFTLRNFEPNTSYRIRVCASNQEFPNMGACSKDVVVKTKKRLLRYNTDNNVAKSRDAKVSASDSLRTHSLLIPLTILIFTSIVPVVQEKV